jgi:hypothetical protein
VVSFFFSNIYLRKGRALNDGSISVGCTSGMSLSLFRFSVSKFICTGFVNYLGPAESTGFG